MVIVDALKWYEDELEQAFLDTDISGNLVRANQNQPGFVAYYDAMHTDLDAILELVERNLRVEKAKIMKEWLTNPPTNLKTNTTELKMLLEAHEDVVTASDIVAEVRYVYKQYGSLLKALDSRGYTLNNIVKLRTANMEEVEI